MRGEILSINEKGGIVLSSENGKRYNLLKNTSEADDVLIVGQKVDFTPDGENAVEVFIIKSETVPAVSNDTEASKAGKTAAIGAGINIFSAIPGLGLIFAITGVVVELMGIKKLAEISQKPQIFSHMLWGEILGLIGMAVAFFVGMMGASMSMMGDGGVGMGIGAILAALIMLVFGIASIVQVFKGLSKLSMAYNVSLLKTAAWLYIAGMLTLPLGIGIFLLVAYQICKIVGYIQIK